MCQAYEAERRIDQAIELRINIKGFAAARKGKPIRANPYHKIYQATWHEEWNHGWYCWKDKILPWALEKIYHDEGNGNEGLKIKEAFAKNRKLPRRLTQIVNNTAT